MIKKYVLSLMLVLPVFLNGAAAPASQPVFYLTINGISAVVVNVKKKKNESYIVTFADGSTMPLTRRFLTRSTSRLLDEFLDKPLGRNVEDADINREGMPRVRSGGPAYSQAELVETLSVLEEKRMQEERRNNQK